MKAQHYIINVRLRFQFHKIGFFAEPQHFFLEHDATGSTESLTFQATNISSMPRKAGFSRSRRKRKESKQITSKLYSVCFCERKEGILYSESVVEHGNNLFTQTNTKVKSQTQCKRKLSVKEPLEVCYITGVVSRGATFSEPITVYLTFHHRPLAANTVFRHVHLTVFTSYFFLKKCSSTI